MEGKTEEAEDIGSASSGSFIDDSDDGSSSSELDGKAHLEVNYVFFLLLRIKIFRLNR